MRPPIDVKLKSVRPQMSDCAGAHICRWRSVISAVAPFRPGALRRSSQWLNTLGFRRRARCAHSRPPLAIQHIQKR